MSSTSLLYNTGTASWWPGRIAIALMALALCFGTNVPVLEIAGRTVYLGTSEAAILICALTAVAGRQPMRFVRLAPQRLTASVLVLTSIFVASWILNELLRPQYLTVGGAAELVRWLVYLPLLFAVPALARTSEDVVFGTSILMLGLLANTVAVIWQAITLNPYARLPYGLILNAIDREGGVGANRNALGLMLALGACFWTAFVIHSHSWRRRAAITALCLTVASVAATGSRSALLGMLAGLGGMGVAIRRRRLSVFASFALVIGLLAVVVASNDYLLTRLQETLAFTPNAPAAAAIFERFDIWSVTIDRMAEFFVVGIGYGAAQAFLDGRVVDNFYLELLIGAGVTAPVAFLWVLRQVGRLSRQLAKTGQSFESSYGLGMYAWLWAIGIASVSGSVIVSPRLMGMFFLAVGLEVTLLSCDERTRDDENRILP